MNGIILWIILTSTLMRMTSLYGETRNVSYEDKINENFSY